jgi:hypothetical protein
MNHKVRPQHDVVVDAVAPHDAQKEEENVPLTAPTNCDCDPVPSSSSTTIPSTSSSSSSSSRSHEAMKQLLCGGLAGSIAKTVTAPFSRLTILFQVHSLVTTKEHRPKFATSMTHGLSKIVERGGLVALWRGNMTSVLHRFPYSAINFYVYENTLDVLSNSSNSSNSRTRHRTKESHHHHGDHDGSSSSSNSSSNSNSSSSFALPPNVPQHLELAAEDPSHSQQLPTADDENENDDDDDVHETSQQLLRRWTKMMLSTTTTTTTTTTNTEPTTTTTNTATTILPEPHTSRLVPPQQHLPLPLQYKKYEDTSAIHKFTAGAVAGVTAVTVCYPLDLVRTRLSTELEGFEHYRGITNAFQKIYQTEGIMGFYSGIAPTLGVAVPNFAISYTTYGTLKEYMMDDDLFYNLRRIDAESGESKLGFLLTVACGAASGILATLITFPMDTIRRRMQVQNLHVVEHLRMSSRQQFQYLLQKEGWSSLYRGLTPELFKVIPMVGTMFLVYEQAKEFMNVTHDRR